MWKKYGTARHATYNNIIQGRKKVRLECGTNKPRIQTLTHKHLFNWTNRMPFITYLYHTSPTCFVVSNTIFRENLRVLCSKLSAFTQLSYVEHWLHATHTILTTVNNITVNQQSCGFYILWRNHRNTDNSCVLSKEHKSSPWRWCEIHRNM
jgi:hypothetical protein